jgi:hypothetical protein
MQQALLDGLLAHKRELEEELVHVEALIRKHQASASKGQLKMMPRTRQPRVRGVLAAARKAVDLFSEPFDKNQLLEKLREVDEDFAHKKISVANIRNTLRLLTQDGIIRVQSEATATTRATYIKAA